MSAAEQELQMTEEAIDPEKHISWSQVWKTSHRSLFQTINRLCLFQHLPARCQIRCRLALVSVHTCHMHFLEHVFIYIYHAIGRGELESFLTDQYIL
jgi:hypothetical protein